MFSWFNASEAQKFGTTLAEFFIQRVPVELSQKNKQVDKQQEVVQKMLQQVAIYKVNNKMNIYRKAKLANSFKWRLLDVGYPSEVVDKVTKILLINF